jgi:hypothetical protein
MMLGLQHARREELLEPLAFQKKSIKKRREDDLFTPGFNWEVELENESSTAPSESKGYS